MAEVSRPDVEKAENRDDIEVKFNPWHDPRNGQFTFDRRGQRFAGGGGSFGGGGASGKWNTPKPKPKPKTDYGGFGGGRSGGGGASASWEKPNSANPQPKPLVTPLAKPLAKPLSAPPEKLTPMVAKPPGAGVAAPVASIRRISAGGYHFEADSQDRTVRAYGELRLQPDQPRSRSAEDNAGKPNREPKDHGGHFIGRQFGGPEISYNHFAQNARFNTSDYRKLENEWKKELKAGRKIKVDIRSIYVEN